MASDVLGFVELSKDRLCQNLAELDTHLVWSSVSGRRALGNHCLLTERVDSPNNALDENFVLIKSD